MCKSVHIYIDLRRASQMCPLLHWSVQIWAGLGRYAQVCAALGSSAQSCAELFRSAQIYAVCSSAQLCADLLKSVQICSDLCSSQLCRYLWRSVWELSKSRQICVDQVQRRTIQQRYSSSCFMGTSLHNYALVIIRNVIACSPWPSHCF